MAYGKYDRRFAGNIFDMGPEGRHPDQLLKNLNLIKNSQEKSQDEKILLIFLVINALNEMIEKIMSGFPGGES